MDAPEISVVLPVHNAAAHLGPLLASLLGQTERSLEVIAVDDGSSDGSLALLHAAAAGDARLTVLSQRQRGVSAARNAALARTRGRWVAFADSDDWLAPHTLQTWRELGDRANLEMVLGNGYRFAGAPEAVVVADAPQLVRGCMPSSRFSGADWIEHCVAHGDWAHFVWLQLIRRELLLRSGLRFVEGIVHEDVLWSMQLGLQAQRVGFAPQPLYGYRIHAASLTHSPALAALQQRAKGYLVVMQHFIAAADDPRHERPLRRALMRHAQREGRNFFALMRHGVLSAPMRRELAHEFLQLGLLRAMFEGAENALTLWRAVRCWVRLKRCAHGFPGPSADEASG